MPVNRFLALLLAGLLVLVTGVVRAEPATADAILQAHIDAMGGSAALARIESRTFRATISSGLLKMRVESTLVRPNRFEDRGSFLGMGSSSGYDGKTGWMTKRGDTEIVQGVELARAIRGHSLDWDQQIRRWYPVRQQKLDLVLDGRRLRVVEMTAATGEKETWRFDAATGLLHQIDGFSFEKDQPPAKLLTTFDDYRTVDGIRLAHRVTLADGKREMTMVITELAHNQVTRTIRAPAAH